MTGVPRRLSSPLTSFMTLMRWSFGIMMSRMTTSGLPDRMASRPSSPSPAVLTSNPSDSKLSWSMRRTTGSSSTMRTLSAMPVRYPVRSRRCPLPAAPLTVGGARPVALLEVLEPGQAVAQAAWSVAGQPHPAVGLDEGVEFVGQVPAAGVGDRGQPAVALQAVAGVAAHERHQLGTGAQLVEHQVAIGPARLGAAQTFGRVSQALLHAEKVVDRQAVAEGATELQLREVEVHDEHRHVPHLRDDALIGVTQRQ